MSEDEQEIRALIASWLAASGSGDTEQVLKLMADDVVFLMPGHPPLCGRSAFAAGQAALRNFDIRAEGEVQEVRVMGAMACSWMRLSVTVTPLGGGTSVRRAGDVLSVFEKRAGRWLLVRDANMLSHSASSTSA